MAFTTALTAKMSGASPSQLAHWRATDVLVPEIEHVERPYLYSFRDVVALRTFAWLRGDHSLQRIRKALATANELALVAHPSEYVFVESGSTIAIELDGRAVDIDREPGQTVLGRVGEIFAAFETLNGKRVDDLMHPRAGVEVNPDRLGGWPTIRGTRIPYDVIARLVADGSVSPDRVADHYPGVTTQDALDALDYSRSVSDKVA
jgi:uncharacterized protein (DUF433 family)